MKLGKAKVSLMNCYYIMKDISYFKSAIWISMSLMLSCKDNTRPIPSITDISPSEGITGTWVTISTTGFQFSSTLEENIVSFNGTEAVVLKATKTQLKVEVPEGATTGPIEIMASNNSVISQDNFTILDKTPNTWYADEVQDYPGIPKENIGFIFVINDKAYVGGAGQDINNDNVKDFWEYNPITNTWQQKADFPGVARNGATGFVIGNKGYMGTGYSDILFSDFWEYDPRLDEWKQLKNFEGEGRSGAVAFSIGNRGYLGLGYGETNYLKDLWQYDPVEDDWVQQSDFEGTPMAFCSTIAFDDKLFVGLGQSGVENENEFWLYEPTSDDWTPRASYPDMAATPRGCFSIHNNGYVVAGNSTPELWKYDVAENSWDEVASPSGVYYNPVVFVLSPYAYMGMGKNASSGELTGDFFRYLHE